jgi:acetylornithine deacetylase/succinyl-diaminopimelate desuccinylase-like protein
MDLDLAAALTDAMPRHRAELEELVRIPSISAPGYDPAQVRRSAEAVRDLLAGAGLQNARLLEVEGAHPAVLAERRDAPGAPTVLLYAHHDVQPIGEESAWTSPAFEPSERDGRLYGRGVGDDKGGVLVHVAAVSAWLATAGRLPVNVKVFVEGEEEIGSPTIERFLADYADDLAADVVVVTDAINWKVGTPALTTSLRGLVDCTVEVRTLEHGVHSGLYGGPAVDALTALTTLLSTLVDEQGRVAVPAILDDVPEVTDEQRARLRALDLDVAQWRREAALLDGVGGTGDAAELLERLWYAPAISVIGIDATSVATSSNTLIPAARARVSLRLAPGQHPHQCLDALTDHLRSNAPFGAHVEVTEGSTGDGAFVPDDSSAVAAARTALERGFGRPAVVAGAGGSIPFVAAYRARFGDVPTLLTGVLDPDSRAHGLDESMDLGDFAKAALAEAYLLAELGTKGG